MDFKLTEEQLALKDAGLFYRRALAYESICGGTDMHYENIIEKALVELPA